MNETMSDVRSDNKAIQAARKRNMVAHGRGLLPEVMHVNAAPAIEVPPCMTRRQFLEIMDTQPDP